MFRLIKFFDSQYAGSVDLPDDDVGFEATPVNDRWLSDESLAYPLHKSEAMAKTMDGLGYDTLWFAEHHFQREGYECLPNLLLLSTHLAQVTKKLRFGCAFNIATMWHPLRLAEDFAMADHLTGGRVTFGVGRGYHTREVESFGSPMLDQDANRELFEEQIEVIFKAFNNRSFSHQGKHYQLPPSVPYRGYQLEELTLVPRPRTLPVECWQPIVSVSPRGLDFMVKNGIKGLITSAGRATDDIVGAWVDANARAGKHIQPGEDLTIGYTMHISSSKEQAVKEIGAYFEEAVKMVGPLGFFPMTPEQVKALENPRTARLYGVPTTQQALASGSMLCGTPDEVTESILAIQEKYPGLERLYVSCTLFGCSLELTLDQLQRFAEDVMPNFNLTSPA